MIKINNLYRIFFVLILCNCLIVPIQGSNTCGPSKGLISGLTLSSNYVAPTGSVAEKPGFVEDNEQSIQTKVDVDDFVLIGNSQLESGNYQEAITAYDQAIKSDPTNSMAWNGKMSALLYLDKYEDVISLFADAKKTMPNDFGIWINKGRAEFYLNEFAKARQSADEALKISPDNIDALVLKADGLAIQAKPGAYEITEKVLSLDPDNTDIWFARGHALYSKWALEGTLLEEERINLIDYLKNDLKFHPDRECSKKLLGLSYQMSGIELNNEGKYEEAIDQYENSLNIDPDDSTTWYEKAYSLINLNRFDEALEACEKSLELDSDDEKAWYLKGYILYSLDRFEEALKPINMAISLGHEKAVALKEEISAKINIES
ncbi:MAG: tetratricopeptide repeat protein, partial [Candidatus Cloacimonetes bacterium]|nr:tetratricopeptide repeat protein [Candidatus Cloacimonadota bacterium]